MYVTGNSSTCSWMKSISKNSIGEVECFGICWILGWHLVYLVEHDRKTFSRLTLFTHLSEKVTKFGPEAVLNSVSCRADSRQKVDSVESRQCRLSVDSRRPTVDECRQAASTVDCRRLSTVDRKSTLVGICRLVDFCGQVVKFQFLRSQSRPSSIPQCDECFLHQRTKYKMHFLSSKNAKDK